MKTGGHIKPCNVGSVEEHNERREEYVERMKHSKHPLNFYPELAPRANFNKYNEQREQYIDRSTGKRLTIAQVFEKMIKVYTEKDARGRRPPLKWRERTDPKTGKKEKVAGWSPIREMIVVIKPDTKPEEFEKVTEWFRSHGVETLHLSLHFDEGHLDENGNLKVNYHAHMGLDFFNWETGKTNKLGKKKMKELQDVLADALGMERGEIKEITGAEHLDVPQYREVAEAVQEKRGELQLLEKANTELQRAKEELERDIIHSEATIAEKKAEFEEYSEEKRQEASRLQDQIQEKKQSLTNLQQQAGTILSDARSEAKAIVQTAKDEADAIRPSETFKGLFGQSAKDKTIKQLQDTIAKEPDRTAAAIEEAKRDFVADVKKAAGLVNDKITSPAEIGKAWRNAWNLADSQKKELERQGKEWSSKLETVQKEAVWWKERWKQVLAELWPSAIKAIEAVIERVNSTWQRLFTAEQVKAIDAALKGAKDTDERVGWGTQLVKFARPLFKREDSSVDADVEDIARNGLNVRTESRGRKL